MKIEEQSSQLDSTQVSYLKEQCILVDINDSVVGKASKRDCHKWTAVEAGSGLHRAFSVFIFNSREEILLQKRSRYKITFPGVWTNACCSHPLYVDSELDMSEGSIGVRRAAQRKLQHELGIPADKCPLSKMEIVSRILYKTPCEDGVWGEHELDYCIILRCDAEPVPNWNEVAEVRYLDKNGIKDLVDQSRSKDSDIDFSPWFLLIYRHFLFDWWGSLNDLSRVKDDKIHDMVDCGIEKTK